MTNEEKIPDVIKAHSFEVVDAQGKTRAVLGFPFGVAGLRILNSKGKTCASLTVDDDDIPNLIINDSQGNPRAWLSVAPVGWPSIFMLDEKGKVIWKVP